MFCRFECLLKNPLGALLPSALDAAPTTNSEVLWFLVLLHKVFLEIEDGSYEN